MPAQHASWMAPTAATTADLLYVSNAVTVSIYSYKDGNAIGLVGTLTGFEQPKGVCADSAGNVFVTDYQARTIDEYAHGGTERIKTLKRSSGGNPYACAVDPLTDTLAVSFDHPYAKFGPDATVVLYPNESGGGVGPYTSQAGFLYTYFLSYDRADNLYLDAEPCGESYCLTSDPQSEPPALYVLQKGQKQFARIGLKGFHVHQPSGVVWVNPSLLVGDNGSAGKTFSGYKVLIDGVHGSLKDRLSFSRTRQSFGFTVHAGLIIVPDETNDIVRLYSLENGSLVSSFTEGLSSPFAAVISEKGS